MFLEYGLRRQEERSPVSPDYFVLFPSPAFLATAALARKSSSLNGLLSEYASVFGLLVDHVGRENVRLVRNPVTLMTKNMDFTKESFPDIEGFDHVTLKTTTDHPTVWTRDGFQAIGPYVFVNPTYFQRVAESDTVKRSLFGEGGMVLHAQKAVLVSEALWRGKRIDCGFRYLEDEGYVVAPLPQVDPSKQKYEYNERHIDGQAALIVDKEGGLRLLVAESYSRQGNGTRKKINFAADTIGAKVFEVDDHDLTPLALNLVQLEDGSVIVSGSASNDLTFVLQSFVGMDKVLITKVPIAQIPQCFFGGIRCLTNTIPKSLLGTINVS